ncbi:MAG TPA: PRC-barrel domain-containing protein [Roseomonas sp.]|jgi:sporulation protein YlmC with PRC-barrel domain
MSKSVSTGEAASRGNIARDETVNLISSDKVEGSAVYDTAGEELGAVHSVMIDKTGGKVAYAVVAAGGALVTAANYYPVPWAALRYDVQRGGYVIGHAKDHFGEAPNFGPSTEWQDRDAAWFSGVDRHWAP